MDISDIQVVVQWRATCTLSTLWQRLGRAGRNRSIEATTLFLVEKEHFNEEKAKREERKKTKAEKQKRKRGDKDQQLSNKRAQRLNEAQTTPLTNVLETSQEASLQDLASSSDESDDISEQLRERYTTRIQEKTKKQGARTQRVLEPAMDDLINARTQGLPCRRFPLDVFFENNKASKCHGCSRVHAVPVS
jgi:superfamily II DNA/RNA helicase